jgi:CubicO group peptidase (beta-lactamase class C family)
VRLFTRRAAGTRALGWDTCDRNSACGGLMTGASFGHTGFTGTSLWFDPEQRMFVLLLTNRVHNARAARPAKVISDVRADLADAAELAVLDDPRGVADMPSTFRADEGAGWNQLPRPVARPTSSARGEARLARKATKLKGGSAVRAVADRKASRKSAASKPAPSKSSAAKGGRGGGKSGAKGGGAGTSERKAASGTPRGTARAAKGAAKASGKTAGAKVAAAKVARSKRG